MMPPCTSNWYVCTCACKPYAIQFVSIIQYSKRKKNKIQDGDRIKARDSKFILCNTKCIATFSF